MEDLNEHGRLLTLKQHFVSMLEPHHITDEFLAMFQLKDFCALDEKLAAKLLVNNYAQGA